MTCQKCGNTMSIDLSLDIFTSTWLRPWKCLICAHYIYPGALADNRTNGANHHHKFAGKMGPKLKNAHGIKKLMREG